MGESDLDPLEIFHGTGNGKLETSVSLAERSRQREIQRYDCSTPYTKSMYVRLGV
jgi:hypothetical protein